MDSCTDKRQVWKVACYQDDDRRRLLCFRFADAGLPTLGELSE